jgi:excisionase family DNA binding protein
MAAPPKKTARPQLIGARVASAEYGVKYTSLRGIIHRAELPHVRVGRAIYVDRNDVEKWIEDSKKRAG